MKAQPIGAEIQSVIGEIYPSSSPGAALLIVKNDSVIFDKGFGFANLSKSERVNSATHFRMASVSKQFTAMVILILEKEGKLSIADPAAKYLTSLPAFAGDVTIRQLMTHTSGIADYEDLIAAGQKEQVNDVDVLHLISHSDSLYFAPGTQFRYSNTGFCLLTQIAEGVSGKPYPELIRELIFEPLKMSQTVIYQPDKDIFERAFGYHSSDGRWQFADQSITSATMGDGAVYTSTDEYRKWIEYLLHFGSLDMKNNPLVPQVHIKKGLEYGFGWFISRESDGSSGLFHSGESTGFHNIVYQNPSKRLLVVFFTNSDDKRLAEAFNKAGSLMNIHPEAVPDGVSLFDYLSSVYND